MDFNIHALPIQSSKDPIYQKAVAVLPSCGSLEEIIYRLVNAHFRIDCSVIPDDEGVLMLGISDNSIMTRPPMPKQLFCIPFPMSQLRKMYKYETINNAIHPLADKANTLTEDDEFFIKREAVLKIKTGERYDNRYAPPSAMCPLILSYADAGMGYVTIEREFLVLKRYPYPEDAVRLNLVHIPSGSDNAVAQESIYIPCKQLKNVINQRRKKSGKEILS